MGHEVVVPGHVVALELHDPEIGDRGAEVRAHQGRQVPVEVVRGDVHLERLRQGSDAQGLQIAVPGHVHDGHVDGVLLEERLVLAPAVDGLKRSHRRAARATHSRERRRLVQVHLQPGEAVRLHGLGNAHQAFGLLAEIEVQHQPHLRTESFAQRGELVDDRVRQGHIVGLREIEAHRPEARVHHVRYRAAKQDRVGLHRLETARNRFATQRLHVVQRTQRRRADDGLEELVIARAERAAVGPVDRQLVAVGAAEKRADRHAERLGLDVEAGVLDGRQRLLVGAARGHSRDCGQRCAKARHIARVLPDRVGRQPPDHRGEARVPSRFVEFRPPHQPFVRGDLEVGKSAPSRIGVQVLDLHDLHCLLLTA